MFSQLHAASKRQGHSTWLSLALHLGLLVALVFPRSAMFLAPHSVQRGEPGGAVTPLYFGHQPSANAAERSQEKQANHHPMAQKSRLTWTQARRTQTQYKPESESPPQAARAAQLPPVGSPFGSLSQGSLYGQEIRPALPVYSPDPVFEGDDLAGLLTGSVVIEVTIDEAGKIVQKVVVQSLGPAIDAKVLAALENWQFRPATRNGVPIPSKQDVYYHYPR